MSLVRLSIPAWNAPCGLRVSPDNTISDVHADSTAQKAGCKIGDKIVSVDDIPVDGRGASSVFDLLSSRKAGATVTIELRRSANRESVRPESSHKAKASSSRKRKADEAPPEAAKSKQAGKAEAKAPAGKATAKAPAARAPAGKAPAAAGKQPVKRNSAPKPLTKWPNALRFRDYTNPDENYRISKLELKIMKLCGAIRNKKDWVQKLSDPSITSKWTAEAAKQFGFSGTLASRATALALDELRWQAGEGVLPGGVEGTFASDDALPKSLHDALAAGFASLASGPKDWHPGSDGQVLDLVHPSLFCYERGVTPELSASRGALFLPHTDFHGWKAFLSGPRDSAKPAVQKGSTSQSSPSPWASQQGLAWLPAEFALSADGKQCQILSYINGLDPSVHHALYPVLGECFVHMAPLLEAVLSGIAELEGQPVQLSYEAPCSHRRPHLPVAIRDEPQEYGGYGGSEYGGSDSEYGGFNDHYGRRASDAGQPIHPRLPAVFKPPPRPPLALSLRGRQLQVIVKLASIRLTPEAPVYKGGSWHVEGMSDEAIVATAIYYASCENTTASSLAFRQAHSNYVPSAQNYHDEDGAVYEVYGLANGSMLTQQLGTCSTIEHRALAFPNTLQHRVQPFKLADETKPGRRDILVFFLVDPTKRITSTANVPPQQASWPGCRQAGVLAGMSYADACMRRNRLMTERGLMTERTVELFEQTFSLCEH